MCSVIGGEIITGLQVTPYGSWRSPIKSDEIASGVITFSQISLDGKDIYWEEMRPFEGGRLVIVQRSPEGLIKDITPSPFNARTRVHEYGGGAFTVLNGVVYFSNFVDQRLYRQEPGANPIPLTPAGDMRYADGIIDCNRHQMICVCEDHTMKGREAVNTIISVGLGGNGIKVLVSGNDFYSSPRLSPDGSRLAWLTWNHPNMPWDGTELWVGDLDDVGNINNAHRVAGDKDESIVQPEWSPDGVLHFISDRTGWWNLYRWRAGCVEPLFEMDAEFARPQWTFGNSSYAFESASRIICTYTKKGIWQLADLDTATGVLGMIEIPYTDISSVRVIQNCAVFIAGSPVEPYSIVQLDLTSRKIDVLRRSLTLQIDSSYLSMPKAIEYPTDDGMMAYAFFYTPKNRDFIAPANEHPPLIVIVHGGPTSATSTTLNLAVQYWTSRGIAVLDVNYRGSAGYGRMYRQSLKGKWGISDVYDCVNGATYLVEHGDVDGNRLAIRGGSAGGFTTLSALTFHNIFKAGASYYGISDLELLTKETHKFESRYTDQLIGPYPARRDIYWERSPIHFVSRLTSPVIFFQGREDKIVPPNQAEIMFAALKAKGVPTAIIMFEGEQHGFRKQENIKRALEGELYFYSRVFKFEIVDPVEPVLIENL